MVFASIPRAETPARQQLADWFDAYHLALFRHLRRLAGDDELAADLLQETFARALAALQRQEPPQHPYAWLCRIGSNLLIDHLRKQRPRRWFGLPLSAPSPDQAIATSQAVRQCLGQLSRSDAELLVMAHCADLSPKQIAELLGEQVSTIRVRLHRARHRFRDLYGQEIDL